MIRVILAALAIMLFSAGPSSARDWVLLGERHVGFVNDRDTIHVGRHDGRFVRLKLIVRREEIKLNSVRVVFGNREEEVVPFEQHLHRGEEAVIRLPHGWHEGRFIHEVELHYHTSHEWHGREAVVELWGQED